MTIDPQWIEAGAFCMALSAYLLWLASLLWGD